MAQFVCAPILGALSDRFGRRRVLLLSMFGLGVDYVIMGFAPSLGWLFAGRIVAGVMGASITTANAYIADISTPETRGPELRPRQRRLRRRFHSRTDLRRPARRHRPAAFPSSSRPVSAS